MLAIMLCAGAIAGAQTVDLTAADAYVRPGFSLEWVFQTPLPGEAGWTVVPANPGDRPIVIRELGLPGSAEPTLFPLGKVAPERYCVMVPFVADERLLASRTGVGLYMAQVGQNWQIYLNGSLIRDETYTDSDGSIRIERAVRGALIDIDARYLNKGNNLVTVMVLGDPRDDRTGLYMGAPYLIDEYDALEALRRESLKLILIGIYFFFALYHAILYALRPKAVSYLYYGLATGLLSIYLFSRTFIVYELILDTRVIKGIELSSLFLVVPAFMAFFDSVLGRRVSTFAKVYGAVFGIAAILRLFFWSEAFLRLWQYTIAIPLAYVLIFNTIMPIIHAFKKGASEGGRRTLGSFVVAFLSSGASKLLLGTVVIATTVLLDVVGLNAGRAITYSDYAFLLLVFGTAATLASQFVKAYKESEALGADLLRRVEARSQELEATMAEQGELSVRLQETSQRLQTRVDTSARDMRVATRVQQGFFPVTAPRNDEWDTAFTFIPAAGISGDFYDFYTRGSKLDGLVVGDVSGHGIASGLITVLARSVFHRNFYERKNRSLGAVLEAINDELIPELSAVENFLTAALLRLGDNGTVEYASAAHTEILYRGATKPRALLLKPTGGREYKGPVLGREGIESPYTSVRFALKPGDAILVYTDGFDEAKNVDGEPFGVAGVLEAFSTAPAGDATQMLDFVVREWRFHVSGTRIADDTTAILLKKL